MREKKLIAALRRIYGATIDILAIDCLNLQKTKSMFSPSDRRIAGVFYLAVQLNDQLFTNLTSEQHWKTGATNCRLHLPVF